MRLFNLVLVVSVSYAAAYRLPSNLKQIYDEHKHGSCKNTLAQGFADGANGGSQGPSFVYCGDIPGAIFLHSQLNGGQYDNMDIDCDGDNRSDGACATDTDTSDPNTAFQNTLQGYNVGISNLQATIHPYVVFGNDAGSGFNPMSYGMEPLSVIAVVCNNQVFYGVWGDVNAEDSTGEASLALANLCFPGEGLSGKNGHSAEDVLYIGFTTGAAVPGPNGAEWAANDTQTFESSIKDLGDRLVGSLAVF